MKMSMMEVMMLSLAMSVLGYSYMKNNPEMVKKGKKVVRDASKKLYTKLENGD